MSTSPAQLVFDGILTTHHIYRTAKVNVREMDLCTGLSKDEFPDLLESESTPGQFYLSNCAKSLANGDILTSDQWTALTTWHAGLSCQIYLQQGMVIDIFGTGFQSEFEKAKGTIKVSAHEKYQQFLCYELHRGTPIPAGVGIERDGENHVVFTRPATIALFQLSPKVMTASLLTHCRRSLTFGSPSHC